MRIAIYAKLNSVGEENHGMKKDNTEWTRRTAIITPQNSEASLAVDCWNDKTKIVTSLPVDSVRLWTVDIKSRESGGRWWTYVECVSVQ